MKLLAAAAAAPETSSALAALPRSGRPQTPTDVLADAKKAFDYAAKNITTSYECGWTRGTYMIGLWDYYNATKCASRRPSLPTAFSSASTDKADPAPGGFHCPSRPWRYSFSSTEQTRP